MQTEAALYNLDLGERRTWLIAVMFTVGNILLPQLCHQIPQGGLIFLPIYFFTLVGAYKYGWKTGMIIALASPIVNHVLFGMPPANVLPVLLLKSSALAITAAVVANKFQRVTIPLVLIAVLAYQVIGGIGEALIRGDIAVSMQDFRLGWPGPLIQVVFGSLCIKALSKFDD